MAGDGAAGRAGAGGAAPGRGPRRRAPPPPGRAAPRTAARQLLSHRAGPGGGVAGPGRAWAGVRDWSARAWRAGADRRGVCEGEVEETRAGPWFAARGWGSVGAPPHTHTRRHPEVQAWRVRPGPRGCRRVRYPLGAASLAPAL